MQNKVEGKVSDMYDCPLHGSQKWERRHRTCPYFEPSGASGGRCKVAGGSFQEGYTFETYCLSASQWLTCANYEGRDKSMYP